MPQEEKVLYLTFDDGPTPEITHWALNQLKSYNAQATFFCTGNNVELYPEIFNTILKDGHAIGNHTYSHPKGWTTDNGMYVDQVIKTQQIIDAQRLLASFNMRKTKPVKLFRPPYGQIKPTQANRLLGLGFKIIMWDILAFDWKDSITPEECAQNVISKAGNGSIVVLHDSQKAAKNMMPALPQILDHFNKAGFTFKHL